MGMIYLLGCEGLMAFALCKSHLSLILLAKEADPVSKKSRQADNLSIGIEWYNTFSLVIILVPSHSLKNA